MTREELRVYIELLRSQDAISYDVYSGLIDGIDTLEEGPKWVPVSERLPKKVGTYMTTVDYGRYGLATGQRYYHGKRLGWEDDCVIAWMPLPSPYHPQESEVSNEQR